MELLEELRNAKLKKPPANGKVAFMRHIDQIKSALDRGYTVVDVWRVMSERGEINVQYNQFSVYVRKFIKGC